MASLPSSKVVPSPTARSSSGRRLSSALYQRTGVPLVRCEHCHQRCPRTCRASLAVDQSVTAGNSLAAEAEDKATPLRRWSSAATSIGLDVALVAVSAIELLLCFAPTRSARAL